MSDQVKKPFNGERKPYNGEKRSFGGDKKPYSGKKRSSGGEKEPFNGEKRSFGGEKKPFGGERKPFGGERKPFNGERKPFGGDRKPFGKPAGKPFGRPVEKKPEQPVSDGLPARRVALAVIREVTEKGAFASLDLNERLTRSGLSAADRRLAARLAYDTIEHMLYLDWALDQIMAKPDTDIKLRNILRLGACQILLEDRIPESAATNTAVNLCRELEMPGLAGVCNGILRNLIRKKDELVWPDAEKEPIKARSIRYSVPEWLVERLDADWGTETADALMACHQQENVTIRPNMTKLDDAAFEALLGKKVWQHEKGALPHAWYIRDMADIHFAMIYALAAADTLAVFHSDTEEGELVEQAVNGAQRAQEPAEHPEDKYRSSEKAYKQQEFPSKQGAQHGKIALVHGVGQQRDAAFQGACGTDVLAECRQRDIAQGIENGDDEYKKDQDHIFSEGENPG